MSIQRQPEWSTDRPKVPGWYWCRNAGDQPNVVWEAVVRIDATPQGLRASWMTAPGEADTMMEQDFSPHCQWIGPIIP